MKYKLLALAAILLISSPPAVFSQETSPLTIETGNPVPSSVRTGEPFKVTYRAKFYDQVLVREDQMQPENIEVDPFEITNLEIVPGPPPSPEDYELGLIHSLDFIYTFHIIKPEKGDKKIPPFKFIWVIKKAGTTEDEAKEENELQERLTDEVGVRYVTAPVKPPVLNIRDEMVYSRFFKTGDQLRRYAYWVMGLSSLLFLGILGVFLKSPKTKKSSENNKEAGAAGVVAEEVVDDTVPKKARKKFLRELDMLLKDPDIDKPSSELERKILVTLRELVLIELSGAPVRATESDSPRQILARLNALDPKQKIKIGPSYQALYFLTERLAGYYQDMESGQIKNFTNPNLEFRSLKYNVEELFRKKRFWVNVINYLRKLND